MQPRAAFSPMSEIRFYHLQKRALEDVLPQILGIALQRGMRGVIMTGSAERMDTLNTHLWTFQKDSFLPHGSADDEFAELQPIYLTTQDENPNNADLLILTDGATSDKVADYALTCEIFDGNDETAVAEARDRWTTYKDQGHDLTYYQQNDAGKWEQKA